MIDNIIIIGMVIISVFGLVFWFIPNIPILYHKIKQDRIRHKLFLIRMEELKHPTIPEIDLRSPYYKRKQRLADNGGKHTKVEWEKLKAQYNYACLCCGEVKVLTKDHIQPIAYGGTDSIDNIQPLCKSCNSAKGLKIIDYRRHMTACPMRPL